MLECFGKKIQKVKVKKSEKIVPLMENLLIEDTKSGKEPDSPT